MGASSSLTYYTAASGTKVYYSSARFREVQIYRLIHNEPLLDFPSQACFFVTESITSSLRYSKIIQQPDIFFQNSDHKGSSSNHDVTHVYQIRGPQTLVQMNDPATLRYILFEDPKSPFHLTKAHVKLLSIDLWHSKGSKGYPSLKIYAERHKVTIDPGSGFALILGATNYINYDLYGDDLSRLSIYQLDYAIIKLLREYLVQVNPRIQGWYHPQDIYFHQEYMFFDPKVSLVPDYEDTHCWLRQISVSLSYPDIERFFTNHIQAGRDRLSVLRAAGTTQSLVAAAERTNKEHTLSHLVPVLSNLHHLKSEYNEVRALGSTVFTSLGFATCQQNLKTLAAQMRLYKVRSSSHRKSDSIADHSVWVARTIYKWFQYDNHPWTEHIWVELRNITLLAAFLHDVGKVGDLDLYSLKSLGVKRDHPFRGYEYIMRRLLFKVVNMDTSVSHYDLIEYLGCAFTKVDIVVLALVIALHHFLGELLMSVDRIPISRLPVTHVRFPFSLNIDHYTIPSGLHPNLVATLNKVSLKQVILLHQVLRYLTDADRDQVFLGSRRNLDQLLHIIFAVSAADTYGAYPVDVARTSSGDSEPEFVFEHTHDPDVDVVIDRPFYKFLYHTVGLQQKYMFMTFMSKVTDVTLFLSAWDNFHTWIGHLSSRTVPLAEIRIPYPYTLLRQTSMSTFLGDLFTMLETGVVHPDGGIRSTGKLNIGLALELTYDPDEADTVILGDLSDRDLFEPDEVVPEEAKPMAQDNLVPRGDLSDKDLFEPEEVEDPVDPVDPVDPMDDLVGDLSDKDLFEPEDSVDSVAWTEADIDIELDSQTEEVHPETRHVSQHLALSYNRTSTGVSVLRAIYYKGITVTLYMTDLMFVRGASYVRVSYQDDEFSITSLRYDRVDYLSEILLAVNALVKANVVVRVPEPVPEEVQHILLRSGPTAMTYMSDEVRVTVVIQRQPLWFIRGLLPTDQYGYLEVEDYGSDYGSDATPGDKVMLNLTEGNLVSGPSLLAKDMLLFPLRVSSTAIVAVDDLVRLVLSYVQGSTSSLMLVMVTREGVWSLSVSAPCQGELMSIRARMDQGAVSRIISQVRLWYDRHARFPPELFAEALGALVTQDLTEPLFVVTMSPWGTISDGLVLPLTYKVDLHHSVVPKLLATFASNLTMRLLFQIPL